MATNSPESPRKPLRVNRSRQPKSAYRTIEIPCLDLARLLAWCDNSFMRLNSDSSTLRIQDVEWYRDAYLSIELAFWATIGAGRRRGK